MDNGIIITFATARPKRGTILYENQISPNSVIHLNGAIITVKEVSNYICDDNEDDGIAKWLEKNILEKL